MVLLGGGIGALSRFVVASLVVRLYSGVFPLGTFLINITGSFLIGVLMTLFLSRPEIPANWRLFLVTGVLGGYTTFSSFEWEALLTFQGGAVVVGFLYLALSVLLGLSGAWLGFFVASRVWPH